MTIEVLTQTMIAITSIVTTKTIVDLIEEGFTPPQQHYRLVIARVKTSQIGGQPHDLKTQRHTRVKQALKEACSHSVKK